MMLLAIAVVLGLLVGFLLMTRVPLVEGFSRQGTLLEGNVTIILPARNEEQNLPRLLGSISTLRAVREVIVVDDNSTDHTAQVARGFGARLLQPNEPPDGITGKAWACAEGAANSSSSILLFVDADTFFEAGGLKSILNVFAGLSPMTALSVLPYAITRKPYEEFSLFFNLLMAFGAGGFGLITKSRLFGQSLILPVSLYDATGGHLSVGNYVLENFHLSRRIRAVHGDCICMGGKGALSMRMFPDGFVQMYNGWTKAFADGAKSTDRHALVVSILWLSALVSTAMLWIFLPLIEWKVAVLLYFLAVAQIRLFASKIGSFRMLTCVLFPIPLLFFFVVFMHSAIRRTLGHPTLWRGRGV